MNSKSRGPCWGGAIHKNTATGGALIQWRFRLRPPATGRRHYDAFFFFSSFWLCASFSGFVDLKALPQDCYGRADGWACGDKDQNGWGDVYAGLHQVALAAGPARRVRLPSAHTRRRAQQHHHHGKACPRKSNLVLNCTSDLIPFRFE